MIPYGGAGVAHLATRILAETAPQAVDAYMGADLGMVAMLIQMAAQDFDRAAEVLTADRADIEAIFRKALPLIGNPDLERRMTKVLDSRPRSLRISDLTEDGDVAMRVLIDLHAAVEDAAAAGSPWAADLDRALWTFLGDHVARRAYDSAF